jgi:long-chain fatty acid transport protein
MTQIGFERRLLAVAIASVLATWGATASASGFQLQEQNASGLGNAYSGQSAAAEDASTVYWNPAGMTRLPGRQVVGVLNAIKPSVTFDNNGSTAPSLPAPLPATGIPLGGEGGDAGGWAFVPNAYLSWELTPNQLWLGVGMNTPFGLTTDWDDSWMGRFHATLSEVQSININPAIAWKVNETFSIGGGINAMWFKADLRNQVAYGASAVRAAASVNPAFVPAVLAALAPQGGIAAEGEAKVDGDSWGWGWNLGAMINFSPATRLGVHYRSRIKQDLKGDVDFKGAPVFGAGLGALGAGLNANFANGNIKGEIELPDTASVALSHQFNDRLQVLADYTWTGWSSIQDLSIYRSNGTGLASTPLNFKDSWRMGVGVNYQLNGQWKLRGGIAYDNTPVKDEFRTPRLPDSDRTWFGIGAQYAMSKQWVFDFGYVYIIAKDVSSNLPNLDPAPPAGFRASPKGNLVGTYEANVNILSAQVRYTF